MQNSNKRMKYAIGHSVYTHPKGGGIIVKK